MYPFPDSKPIDSEADIWKLQLFLLQEAELRLGKKNPNKTILRPGFENRGPYILNTKDRTGAHAVLSNKAFENWPITLYELAHETIHLLNPIVGSGNYLEEGIAVAFSVNMAKTHAGLNKQPENDRYREAWYLVKQLPGELFESAKSIRKKCKALSKAKPEDLKTLFPILDPDIITQLCQPFDY